MIDVYIATNLGTGEIVKVFNDKTTAVGVARKMIRSGYPWIIHKAQIKIGNEVKIK